MALSTWISGITNSTLNISLPTFSFQDALDITSKSTLDEYYDWNFPFFFENGCAQEDGSQNCTAACQDNNQIFGSLDTLHNCMLYPTVADLYARRNLSNVGLAQRLNVVASKMQSPLYINITTNIRTCLIDYCTTLPDCTSDLHSLDPQVSPLNITSSFYFYSDSGDMYTSRLDFCAYVPKSFNPDIGGIGVYVSYWIQTGLALLSFILVAWLNWGIYYISLGALFFPRGYSSAKKIAQRIRNNSRNKHLPSLTGALAEFQKAQCFFMMAINIAALVNRNSGGFQPSSLQQLYNTYILIKSISISGYLPVTFTLFTLHLVDVVSWYLLVLSIVTVIVSTVTLFVVGSFSPSQDDMNYLSQQAISGGPASCGTHNLGVYCFSPIDGAYYDSSADPASGAYSMLAFCLVVLVLLVADQYHAFKDPFTGKPRPWLIRIRDIFFRKDGWSLRRVQTGLALISIGLSSHVIDSNGYYIDYDGAYGFGNHWKTGAPEFILFTSCGTCAFVLYLMITSASAHTRTDKPIGRFFNEKIALAFDCLCSIFWFAGFIAFASFNQRLNPCGNGMRDVCGTVVTSILVAIGACVTFIATTAFAALHMLRNRNERLETPTHGKCYWILQRFSSYRLKRRLTERLLLWKDLTRRIRLWNKTIRKKIPCIRPSFLVDRYTWLQENTLPTMMSRIRRVHQDVKRRASHLDWPSTLASAAIVSMYLLFIGFYINWFAIFIQDLEWFAYNGVDVDSWSFGQVVAITVWAEPLCEYFHLELRGMKRGFEHRLWGYQVVKIKQPDAERGPVSDPTTSDPSDRSLSRAGSFEDQRPGEYDRQETRESSGAALGGKNLSEEKGGCVNSSHTELLTEPVPGSRETSSEAEERRGIGEWQIPETVLLTSESISPF